MSQLLQEIKEKVVETLELPDVDASQIGDDDPIVGGSLSIDSIDVLELVIMIEEDYEVKILSKEQGEEVFRSFRSLAEFVEANLPK